MPDHTNRQALDTAVPLGWQKHDERLCYSIRIQSYQDLVLGFCLLWHLPLCFGSVTPLFQCP